MRPQTPLCEACIRAREAFVTGQQNGRWSRWGNNYNAPENQGGDREIDTIQDDRTGREGTNAIINRYDERAGRLVRDVSE